MESMPGKSKFGRLNSTSVHSQDPYTLTYRVFIKYCVFFFLKILKYSGLLPFSMSVCVYTRQAGRTPGLQQNWQSSEKFQNIKEKTQ